VAKIGELMAHSRVLHNGGKIDFAADISGCLSTSNLPVKLVESGFPQVLC
jgi:hypothetical protein